MERVRKTFFDPLATSKARIREILRSLPEGSAHPFSPERILLHQTRNTINNIDISSHEESYFYNAVDLGEMGETLLRRMGGFKSQLDVFKDFQIQQAPAGTFEIPITQGKISIFAVSERYPTYYDFCLADADRNTCCYSATNTFKGISHSGDNCSGNDLLQYVKIDKASLSATKEYCVFISGFQSTKITRFLGTNPALLVANHAYKVLYIIPVPLDSATIGDATLCCPLVIRRRGDNLVCSVLPTAATDQPMSCTTSKCNSSSFKEAIARADFTTREPERTPIVEAAAALNIAAEDGAESSKYLDDILAKETAVFTTYSAKRPSFLDAEKPQVIKFGTGIEFTLSEEGDKTKHSSSVVLPCVFGDRLEGPVLLATGTVPVNVPFLNPASLRAYYEKLKDVVFIVDERMTDNARNLAASWRINAVFVIQSGHDKEPKDAEDVVELLNGTNINAVTALAGPQSLVLVQILDNYYFYRGIANREVLNTSALSFGADVTFEVLSSGLKSMLDPRIRRIINLNDVNTILMPTSGQWIKPQDLKTILGDIPIQKIEELKEDVFAAVPQLQVLLTQKEVQELSTQLIFALSTKIEAVTTPLRKAYVKFVATEHNPADPESVKRKNKMLGELRKTTKSRQSAAGSVITSIGNMVSTQTTSKRNHDLKRLIRQSQIQGNVEAAKSMTFESLAEYLEEYADEMGVMLLNIEPEPYNTLLGTLKSASIDASLSCSLDSRILHLQGLDAGIIMEQSQKNHHGPLKSHSGSKQPIMALPCLTQGNTGSMLAWVCWDEFVNLDSPFTVRWMEKCNEAHISALRIIMRSTLSQAVSSRKHNMQPGAPETGQLMSALLMTAMTKLAAMRTTAPAVTEKADDTVTKLMRGLFGNFLTIAGSGVRPLSMVWQLFGQDAKLDIPTNDVDWNWYETAVKLYPYTGWPIVRFYDNLEKLLDKAILRVVTKNEKSNEIKASRVAAMAQYCKLRNIQLEHSRTIITIFMRMLTTEGVDTAAVATRLLNQVPQKLDRQTEGYSRMIRYLKHLAQGGEQRAEDNATAAGVYTRRSGAFSKVKNKVSEACKNGDWAKMKKYCQIVVDTHAKIAAFWHISPESFKIQNMKVYKELLEADFGPDIGLLKENENKALTGRAISDAEKTRVPWQVGKKGEFSDEIEPLDEAFVHEIMTGEAMSAEAQAALQDASVTTTAVAETKKEEEVGFSSFKNIVEAQFIDTMEMTLSAKDVCRILSIPPSAMSVFVEALNPDFVWADMGENFKAVILDLLKNRANRGESRPVRKLLNLIEKGLLQIEGA